MIVREIVERPSGSSAPPQPPQPPKAFNTKNGFPAIKCRLFNPPSPSIGSPRAPDASPTAQNEASSSAGPSGTASKPVSEAEAIRQSVQEENNARVSSMSTAEREQEVEELKGRFGDGLVDLMRRRREARRPKGEIGGNNAEAGPSRLPSGGDNEMERTKRGISDENRQKVLAMSSAEVRQEQGELEERFDAATLDALKKRAAQRKERRLNAHTPADGPRLETTTALSIEPSQPPEDPSLALLKERYFPNHPAETEKLAWLQPPPLSTDTSVRFDLSGRALTRAQQLDISTSEGLHHHGTSPDLAGYTIEDILWLSRSTVASQRVTMTSVLARIMSEYLSGDLDEEAVKACTEASIQQKGFELGLSVLTNPPRSLGVSRVGIELLYESLAGSLWTWLDGPGQDQFRPDERIEAIPFEDIRDKLRELLSRESPLPPQSIYHLTMILRRAVYHTVETAEIVTPLVPSLARERVLKCPWPLSSDDQPSAEALRLLAESIAASRTCAELIANSNLPTSLVKFLVVSAWSDDINAYEYVSQTLRVYANLGRYGLCASTVTESNEILRDLGIWCHEQCTQASAFAPAREVVAGYFECLTIWTTCAIDPHKTTPEHALTWAQVSAMGWNDDAVQCLGGLVKQKDRRTELTAVLAYLVAWTTGVVINGESGGTREKADLTVSLSEFDLEGLVLSAIAAEGENREAAIAAIVEVIRLDLLLNPTSTSEASILTPQNRHELVELLSNDPTSLSNVARCEILRIAKHDAQFTLQQWIEHAVELFHMFQPGEERFALDLVDELLGRDLTATKIQQIDLVKALQAVEHPDGLHILRPLLHYAILPDAAHVIAPSQPAHMYLKATTTLRRPAVTNADEKRRPGLPLPADWIFTPVNELLESSSSPALAQAPPDWTPSEVDIMRTMLILARLWQAYKPLSRSQLLLNLMKVFMLEHDQQSSTDEPEAFRDDTVASLMRSLLKPLLARAPSAEPAHPALETAAVPFLGPDIPFFQFYTDFVTLFEAISFSDPIFSKVVLPPLAMAYPTDYRKLLWVEHPSILRSIRTKVADVPLETSLEAFFKPKETDADILAGYTRALLRGWLSEERNQFLWILATRHLAQLFWSEDEGVDVKVRESLMRPILGGATVAVVKAIVLVELGTISGSVSVNDGERANRLETVERIVGKDLRVKVEGAFA